MEKPAICGGEPVRSTKIFYGHQFIDEDDIQAVVDVLKSDYLTCGPKIGELEEKLCEVTGAKYAVVCSNGTAALHIACLAAGVMPGDEVITTPITFAASANCALYCGAKPVFADINENTYNIDPAHVEKLTTERTKAVVAVDFTGQSVELDRLLTHCREHNLVLIEDGAHVIGTSYKGRMNGSIADMTTMSFHPVKTVTGGEGGAVLTNSKEYYEKLLLYRAHGITRDPKLMEHEPDGPWYYEQIALGMNYRMTDMQAALIISQLNKLPRFMERRKAIVKAYNEAFSRLPQLFVQQEIPESDTTRHLYILRIRPEKLTIDRKQFFEALAAENICCNVHYIPTYYFPYYEKLGYKRGLCPKAEKLYAEEISLPLYYAMTDQDVEDVIRAVTRIAEYFKA
ncbi:UDP-4-amino-4,6-dideoxy-N-acetyl-beta-L-altrosamine transaminase [Suilimivivens aceti]|uniref:UDP-4-amino-4, 6-dideoxy-N-acetyl-beta-L-altrosamine transaminase n=2 Tax=Lachnospiraceae TaxID=186803 RepID=A0ABT2T0U1_9FIRM|nr:UDP-4-amino-4,6-dideoxy-N-acetyl-beta-L-altrosamine transaminase [Suilimivivens aceti]MCU6743868.1 UDP-4-amino-4,6-dideoxy-N-acetyl-beta-L-altrosamine transaminase [Suilimivivens aceti]SCH41876.1 UDP-4-amino-4-deoxy-L-arabinose--oxoglutarate aminotransferase [uncultured Clostridium sp.]